VLLSATKCKLTRRDKASGSFGGFWRTPRAARQKGSG
jgi:hypothetical protein